MQDAGKPSDTDLEPSRTRLQLAIDAGLRLNKASPEALEGLATPPPRACDDGSIAQTAAFQLISLVKTV